VFIAPYEKLGEAYKVEKIYIPSEFLNKDKRTSGLYDYALVKLAKHTNLDDFIPLSCDFLDKIRKEKIGILGYPLSSYRHTL